MKALDLTGMIFGRLRVDEFAGFSYYPSGKARRMWKCTCLNDGNELTVRANDLVNGHTKSCGCLNSDKRSERKFVDLSGQQINGFNVIKRIGTVSKNEDWKTSTPLYLAQCINCGRYFHVRADYLRSGNTHSCGCLLKQREMEIELFLEAENIDYVKGVSFKDFLSEKGYPLYYDFAIFGSDGALRCIVEEHGVQHRATVNKKKDAKKKDFCISHNIAFEEIWYYESIPDRINEILSKYLHANPVPSVFDEGATTISKESTRLMKFQRGSAVPLNKGEDIV